MTELTTLCYLERDGKYLMLHRVVKKHDVNHDKWIGVGGHFESHESPDECVLREVKEETGYTLTDYRLRGIVTFNSDRGDFEYMFLYTASAWTGNAVPCDEGVLEWVDIEKVWKLNLWEGDKIFFRLLDEDVPCFSLKLHYDTRDHLKEAVLNGRPMELLDEIKEDGTKTGTVKERGTAHREGALHGTVHMWIIRKNDTGSFDLLLQKRSKNKDSNPGKYDISSAGHIDHGQSAGEASERELQEELGIDAGKGDLIPIGTHLICAEENFYGRPFRDHELAHVYLYTKPVDEKNLRLQKEEVESVRWMAYPEVLDGARYGTFPNCIQESELLMIEDWVRSHPFR